MADTDTRDTDTPDTRPSEPVSPPDWSRGEPAWQARLDRFMNRRRSRHSSPSRRRRNQTAAKETSVL